MQKKLGCLGYIIADYTYPVLWTISWKNAMNITVEFFHFVVLFVELPSTFRKNPKRVAWIEDLSKQKSMYDPRSLSDPPKKYHRLYHRKIPGAGNRW